MFSDHRDLAYIFSPVACATPLWKSSYQRLLNWRTYIRKIFYVIRHIPGVDNDWGGLLSRLAVCWDWRS